MTMQATEIREASTSSAASGSTRTGGATFDDLDPFTGDVVARVAGGRARGRTARDRGGGRGVHRRGRRRRPPSGSGSS